MWVVSILGLFLGACTADVSGNDHAPGDPDPNTGGSPPVQVTTCDDGSTDVAMPRRLIRLSFNQIASSLRPTFGEAFASGILTKNQIPATTDRTFPPLGDTSEGSTYIDTKWQSADAIATDAG